MTSDYPSISRYNEEQLGKDTASRKTQVCMYSDPTHFIYEILQNADDYGATDVSFQASSKELIVEHNGQPFTTENVKAISYIGKSTSRDDLVKEGHFGLGFKSVFAFTATPRVFSNDEHFEIHGLYRLRELPYTADLARSMTRFVFPFNHEQEKPDFVDDHIPPEKAYERIRNRLKQLNMATLLFMRNVLEIKWAAEGESGHYLRDDDIDSESDGDFRHRKTTITDGNALRSFEIFGRRVSWHGKEQKPVEVALALDDSGRVVKVNEPLYVLFATRTRTNLHFIMNGPYRTNPARETVSTEDPFNQHLVDQTASLLASALPMIRDMGLLDVQFLEGMPLRSEDFPKYTMFRPIYDRVRTALREESLLPTSDGGHVEGLHAKLARGRKLVDLLSTDQLTHLLGNNKPLRWLSTEITEARADLHSYLVGKKGDYSTTIEPLVKDMEVRPEDFIARLSEPFLSQQDDDWLARLYEFLADQKGQRDALKKIPFIRLEDGHHVIPLKQDGLPNAYLPPDTETDLPIVRRVLLRDEVILNFLKDIGLKEPDIVDEVIDRVLPKYRGGDVENIQWDDHVSDVTRILRASQHDSKEKRDRLFEHLKKTPFLKSVNAKTGEPKYQVPCERYFRSAELDSYFSDNPSVWFLVDDYNDRQSKLFKELGVNTEVRVHKPHGDEYYVPIVESRGFHLRGIDHFDRDCTIHGLEQALTCPTIERSLYIWNELLTGHSERVRGFEEFSRRKNFDPLCTEERLSSAGRLLKDKAWLPDRQGQFHKPEELTLVDLPEDFKPDQKLANSLKMKQPSVARVEGPSVLKPARTKAHDLFDLTQNEPELAEKCLQLVRKEIQKKQYVFPIRQSANPQQRESRVAQRVETASDVNYEYRHRSVRTTAPDVDPRTLLRDFYTNDDGVMGCQICKEELPFKKRDGEYYFEAVQFSDDIEKEHAEIHLALCPVCAARYKEFIKPDPSAVASLKSEIRKTDSLEVGVTLDIQSSIRFVKDHVQDLKVILEALAKEEQNA